MKLHDLRPAEGSRRPRRRVGRGIAAGQGKTAGRGTKGQKSRSGGSLPAWFEGGQTPLHVRIPKLRGFKNRLKIEYEVVNLGAIARLVELGALEGGELPASTTRTKAAAAPITVNQDILRAVGLVRTLDKSMKILGSGEISTPLFVVADAFSKSAVAKIEAAGGTASVIEVPSAPMAAIGVDREPAPAAAEAEAAAEPEAEADAKPARKRAAKATAEPEAEAAAKPARKRAAKAAAEPEAEAVAEPAPVAEPADAAAEPAAAPDDAARESDA